MHPMKYLAALTALTSAMLALAQNPQTKPQEPADPGANRSDESPFMRTAINQPLWSNAICLPSGDHDGALPGASR